MVLNRKAAMKPFKTITITLAILSLHYETLFCQKFTDAWSQGMAGIEIMSARHPNLLCPAQLTETQKLTLCLSYVNRYLLGEISDRGLSIIVPSSFGVAGLIYNQSGYDNFKENTLVLAYGKVLSEDLSAGIDLEYQEIKISDGYGSKRKLGYKASILCSLAENMKLGINIGNPWLNYLDENNDNLLISKFTLTIIYNLTNNVSFSIESEKRTGYPLNLKCGLIANKDRKFFFTSGFSAQPLCLSIGMGFKYQKFLIFTSGSYHGYLGISPAISINYEL